MNTNLNMQTMPIDRLKPAKYNPRKDLKPGDPAYEKIRRSLHDFGYVDPIVWNEVTGNIVGGHQRYDVFLSRQFCVHSHVRSRRFSDPTYPPCRWAARETRRIRGSVRGF